MLISIRIPAFKLPRNQPKSEGRTFYLNVGAFFDCLPNRTHDSAQVTVAENTLIVYPNSLRCSVNWVINAPGEQLTA